MAEAAWEGTHLEAQDIAERARVLNKLRIGDIVFHQLTKGSAILVLVVLGGVILSLFLGALPALQEFGFGFLTTTSWNPVTDKFGALAPIYGTIITSFIAMLIAVPFGLMIAMFLTELCPMFLGARSASRLNSSRAFPVLFTVSGVCSCSRHSCRSTSNRR